MVLFIPVCSSTKQRLPFFFNQPVLSLPTGYLDISRLNANIDELSNKTSRDSGWKCHRQRGNRYTHSSTKSPTRGEEPASLLRNLPIHRYVCLCMIKYRNEVAKSGGHTKTRIEGWLHECGPPILLCILLPRNHRNFPPDSQRRQRSLNVRNDIRICVRIIALEKKNDISEITSLSGNKIEEGRSLLVRIYNACVYPILKSKRLSFVFTGFEYFYIGIIMVRIRIISS